MALQETNYNSVSKVVNYRRKHCLPPALKYTTCVNAGDIEQNLSDTSYSPDMRIKSYKQKQKRLSDDEVGQIIDKYRAGASTYELAADFGCHRSTISRVLKKCGIKVTHNCADRKALVEKILELYADFMKPEDIGKVVDLHVSTVLKILHENGVRIRSSGEYRKNRL